MNKTVIGNKSKTYSFPSRYKKLVGTNKKLKTKEVQDKRKLRTCFVQWEVVFPHWIDDAEQSASHKLIMQSNRIWRLTATSTRIPIYLSNGYYIRIYESLWLFLTHLTLLTWIYRLSSNIKWIYLTYYNLLYRLTQTLLIQEHIFGTIYSSMPNFPKLCTLWKNWGQQFFCARIFFDKLELLTHFLLKGHKLKQFFVISVSLAFCLGLCSHTNENTRFCKRNSGDSQLVLMLLSCQHNYIYYIKDAASCEIRCMICFSE